MDQFRDFTVRNGIGIRLCGERNCRVIRRVKAGWVEIGPWYSLPIEPSVVNWPKDGIPASVLAVALKFYELDHPESTLRDVLTGSRQGELVAPLMGASAIRAEVRR
ncbi:MAG TPA: hypothetical protein VFA28_09350 [Bryobacteraceae bacterium]|jgi:hypothetical protein|nr:hypothetical protein [Bryobacteraceae bacterium]